MHMKKIYFGRMGNVASVFFFVIFLFNNFFLTSVIFADASVANTEETILSRDRGCSKAFSDIPSHNLRKEFHALSRITPGYFLAKQ